MGIRIIVIVTIIFVLFVLQILKKYGTEWIVSIEDITEFVKEQRQTLDRMGAEHVLVAKERVYPLNNQKITEQIRLDSC
jgi:hypothetical protein